MHNCQRSCIPTPGLIDKCTSNCALYHWPSEQLSYGFQHCFMWQTFKFQPSETPGPSNQLYFLRLVTFINSWWDTGKWANICTSAMFQQCGKYPKSDQCFTNSPLVGAKLYTKGLNNSPNRTPLNLRTKQVCFRLQ
jgi:hypothetical protein